MDRSGEWSALFALLLSAGVCLSGTLQAGETVVINEIMYHPVEEPEFAPDGTPTLNLTEDVHEYVELHNYGSALVVLANWKLAGGIHFTFPADATLPADGYFVVAKDKPRLAAVPQYGLEESMLFGPFTGVLSNQGDPVRLENAPGDTVDSVQYSAGFPWPIGADGLGAGEDWTGLRHADYQYRGRSLERLSPTAPGNDPANWLASPLPGEPSPGRPNAVTRPAPLPIVIRLSAVQATDGQLLLRAQQPVRVDALFSATNELRSAVLDYFVDNLNATGESLETLDLLPVGDPATARFTATLPGQPDRTLVRYRIRADRGNGLEVVSPRPGDPFLWHAYFVSPVRSSSNPSYELFISSISLNTLAANINQNPRRVTLPDPPGYPRASWNATEPGILVCDGVVRDIRVRYHGSRYNRGTQAYKFFFPRYNPFAGQHSVLLVEKGYDNVAGYGLFRAAGLPACLTRSVDLYLNNNGRATRLELEDFTEQMLERYHQEQHLLNPGLPREKPGEMYKSMGVIDPARGEGPYGRGDGTLLPAMPPYWTPLQRYEWTYPIQDHDWKGGKNFADMIAAMWQARGDAATRQNPDISALRQFFQAQFDLDKTLTYLAVLNWMGPWDDTTQNHFLWQQVNGKWALLPWDMDAMFNDSQASIFAGEVGDRSNNFRGPNFFKDSFIKAFRQELIERNFLLVNTLLHPDNLTALGYGTYRSFAASRYDSVMQQCGLGPFERPAKPLNQQPPNGAGAFPPAQWLASPYAHSASPAPAHAVTTWEVRTATGSYNAPAFKTNTPQDLTALPIPFAQLKFGETYLWRCTYWDANGHPSVSSDETSFSFGATSRNQTNVISLIKIQPEESWKYNQTSTDLTAAWRLPGYDDSSWSAGAPLFAHETAALPEPIRTPLALGHLTYYFRKPFSYTGDLAQVQLRVNLVLDDGAVVYLNGDELLRVGMPSGDVVYSKLASRAVSDGIYEGPFDVPASSLRSGDNLLAVEVHQVNSSSTDITFGLTLSAVSVTSTPDDLVLNEILAHAPPDPAGGPAPPDWIELYNRSSLTHSLDGFRLTDDPLRPDKYLFPSGLSMPSQSFLVIWCDQATNSPGLHAGFGLKKEGQTVVLLGPSTNGLTVKDSLQYGLQADGSAIGRSSDGAASWQLTRPTPGAANSIQPTGSPEALRINEWMANPLAGDDWIELFNPQPQPVALGGLVLTDALVLSDGQRIPPLSFIAANGFVRLFADGKPDNGADHANLKLSAAGDAVSLLSSNGVTIDRVVFGPQPLGISQGRLPDGAPTIVGFPGNPSPGQSNEQPLRLEALRVSSSAIVVQFDAPANQGCQVEYCDSLNPPNWKSLLEIPGAPTSQRVAVTNEVPLDVAARFYRLRTTGK